MCWTKLCTPRSTPETVAAETFSSRRSPFPQPHGEAVNRRPLGTSVTSSSGPAVPVRHAPERGARPNQPWGAGSPDSWVLPSAPLPLPRLSRPCPRTSPSAHSPSFMAVPRGAHGQAQPLPRRSQPPGPSASPGPATGGCDGHQTLPRTGCLRGPNIPSLLRPLCKRFLSAQPWPGPAPGTYKMPGAPHPRHPHSLSRDPTRRGTGQVGRPREAGLGCSETGKKPRGTEEACRRPSR